MRIVPTDGADRTLGSTFETALSPFYGSIAHRTRRSVSRIEIEDKPVANLDSAFGMPSGSQPGTPRGRTLLVRAVLVAGHS